MATPRTRLLAEAGEAFAAGFNPIAVPWNVVHFLVPRVADCAVLGLLESATELRWVAHAHVGVMDGAHGEATGAHTTRYQFIGTPVARVMRSGRPLLLPRLTQPVEALPAALIGATTRALLVVALGGRRRAFGVLGMGSYTTGGFDADDARLACALALRAAAVLDIASRCRDLRVEERRLDDAWARRRWRESTSRARYRAELTRQLVARQ